MAFILRHQPASYRYTWRCWSNDDDGWWCWRLYFNRLTCQSSTRASNKRKHVTLTDKRMYMYTYKLTLEHIKHMSITVS